MKGQLNPLVQDHTNLYEIHDSAHFIQSSALAVYPSHTSTHQLIGSILAARREMLPEPTELERKNVRGHRQ